MNKTTIFTRNTITGEIEQISFNSKYVEFVDEIMKVNEHIDSDDIIYINKDRYV